MVSGGVIVVAAVVGTLALFETVLPWAFAALRQWRRQAKEAGGVRTQLPSANANWAKTAVANDARALEVSSCSARATPQSVFAKVDALTNDATLAFSDCGVATEGSVVATSENAKSAYRERDLRSNEVDANRLWEEARTMTHRFKPDWKKDHDYLSKIYTAARLGHLEAMVKLGEYAGRRGAVVEAFYWTILAELKGATGLNVQLRELRSRWQSLGCPKQYRNAYTDFTEEQGVFARAVLRLQCGVDPQYARARLKELADRGVPEAQLFLGKGTDRSLDGEF